MGSPALDRGTPASGRNTTEFVPSPYGVTPTLALSLTGFAINYPPHTETRNSYPILILLILQILLSCLIPLAKSKRTGPEGFSPLDTCGPTGL